MAGWSKPPSAFVDEVEAESNRWLRATALQALQGVIERSPVDTGAFRGNNTVSVGYADYSYDETKLDKTGSKALSEGMQIIGRVTNAFDYILIQNNLPYGERLENGWSGQAPMGIYQVTIDSLTEASR